MAASSSRGAVWLAAKVKPCAGSGRSTRHPSVVGRRTTIESRDPRHPAVSGADRLARPRHRIRHRRFLHRREVGLTIAWIAVGVMLIAVELHHLACYARFAALVHRRRRGLGLAGGPWQRASASMATSKLAMLLDALVARIRAVAKREADPGHCRPGGTGADGSDRGQGPATRPRTGPAQSWASLGPGGTLRRP